MSFFNFWLCFFVMIGRVEKLKNNKRLPDCKNRNIWRSEGGASFSSTRQQVDLELQIYI